MKEIEELQPCTDCRKGCCCARDGFCTALEDTDFDDYYCVFYKPEEKLKMELIESSHRLIEIGDYGHAIINLRKLVKLS